MARTPNLGLDVGTCFLVVASVDEQGNTTTKSVRDAFLEMRPSNPLVKTIMIKGFKDAGVSYLEMEDGTIQVIGDESLNQAVVKNMILRRPLAKGVISPKETKALPMFTALLRELLGDPVTPNEKVVYSVPASPIDAKFDEVFHTSAINSILKQLGYEGSPINEAFAIVLSNLGEENYTGMAISFGAGMANICLAFNAEEMTSFATSKGGDYIDTSVAVSLGYDEQDTKNNEITPALVTLVKEGGVDISDLAQSDRTKQAIAIYYQNLIKYTVESIITKVNSLESVPRYQEPITVVVSGGTSKAVNFLSEFKKEFDRNAHRLPFKVKEVRHATDPLNAVAEGCLIAQQAGL
jgi:actin-like ATPase involved in cell morphogenesis